MAHKTTFYHCQSVAIPQVRDTLSNLPKWQRSYLALGIIGGVTPTSEALSSFARYLLLFKLYFDLSKYQRPRTALRLLIWLSVVICLCQFNPAQIYFFTHRSDWKYDCWFMRSRTCHSSDLLANVFVKIEAMQKYACSSVCQCWKNELSISGLGRGAYIWGLAPGPISRSRRPLWVVYTVYIFHSRLWNQIKCSQQVLRPHFVVINPGNQ